ncbi:ABC transporter permease [Streptococcus cuniculipharyngis]|uniref:Multidrug ABC transporter permease n=1 Tax=Streptococcus cuniculipharyngis TaxID=1562651 RepID=A0A5C5SB86_9STRE|nr:ABC transporter permease [Streptococcus cuniculipharyngis]TWS96684.1 multidrug ABC transporter permease [Streptococcus cuniculipharyngis]
MRELFAKRRFQFIQSCLAYLRYVLNDHFVLVLLLLTGFVMVEYSRLLNNFPANPLPIITFVLVLLIMMLATGRVATYLEPADSQFLLVKEVELKAIIKQAIVRAIVIWGGLQTGVLLLLSPLLGALGLSLPLQALLMLFLLLIKALMIQWKSRVFYASGQLNWQAAIAYEKRRQQSILKFFSLFTDVKGLSSRVKRRAYLDGLLLAIPKQTERLWLNLYARAFLRSGDYLDISLRLLFLSLLSLWCLDNRLLAESLALLFTYLWVFQMIALLGHYDYQYLPELYPYQEGRAANLLLFLRSGLLILALIELVFTCLMGFNGLLLVGDLLLFWFYLPYRMRSGLTK